ncbi:MAG: GAF domain-containing protein [Bacteroidia bacterium]
MSEELIINKQQPKEAIYQQLLPQIKALLHGETDLIANMANVSAVLKEAFNFWWVGFYIVKGNELVLGPFQGTLACTRIGLGKGVCGAAWAKNETILVPNVNEFDGHIACSSLSQSEIVIPKSINNTVLFVLDVDSEFLNHFDEIDAKYLNEIVSLL